MSVKKYIEKGHSAKAVEEKNFFLSFDSSINYLKLTDIESVLWVRSVDFKLAT
jgi:hypothetical protein